jgi:hypothetical protein
MAAEGTRKDGRDEKKAGWTVNLNRRKLSQQRKKTSIENAKVRSMARGD